MALTEIYIDPSIAANSGTGTIGDPFGDLEYAIVQSTFDTVNGTRLNIKAGTAEFLVTNLETSLVDTSVSVAWVNSAIAPLVFQGYTAVAGDGGRCKIDAGSGQAWSSATRNSVMFYDCWITTTSASAMFDVNDNWMFIRCKVGPCGGTGLLGDSRLYVDNCFFTGVVATCMNGSSGSIFINNFVDRLCIGPSCNATSGASHVIANNVIETQLGDTGLIQITSTYVFNNSICCLSGTGVGVAINCQAAAIGFIKNNVIEGFNGVGGRGIELSVDNLRYARMLAGNSFYNCETNIIGNNSSDVAQQLAGDNETLSASPFTNPSLANYSPVDTGSVKQGHSPQNFMDS